MARKRGAIIPDPVNPPGTRKLVICVPDTVEWLSLVTGCVSQMRYGWYWDRATGDLDAVRDRAKQMYFEMQDQSGDCDMNCEEFIACIQPLFDALTAQLDAIQAIAEAGQAAQTITAPAPVEITGCDVDAISGGALAVVQAMDFENRRLYAAADTEGADNLAEWADIIIEGIPALGALPFDEIGALVNWFFANQVLDYEASYDSDFEFGAACSLRCFIEANDCKFDYTVWGSWLQDLPSLFDPGHVAAGLYSRYAPANTTFFNQVAELIDPEVPSLKSYFDDLYRAFFIGSQDPVTLPDCECPEDWEHTIDFTVNDGDFDAVVNVNTLALYGAGVGWAVNTVQNTNTVAIQRALPAGHYTSIEFTASAAPAYVSAVTLRTDLFPAGSQIAIQSNNPGTAVTELAGSWTDPGVVFVNYSKTASTTFSGYTGVLTSVTFRGTGVNPFL